MAEAPCEPESTPIAMVEGSGPMTSLFDRAYPKALRDAEGSILKTRRQQAGLTSGDWTLGVGLSGGGIRSATFCLGLFQAMAGRPGFLRRIDFLSTVSGGGYFGTFFGRLLGREFIRDADHVEEILRGETDPGILKYLRENGRYLSPNGAGDLLLGGSVLLRNWFSIHLVLVVTVLAVFLGLQVPRALPSTADWMLKAESFANFLPGHDRIWWSPYMLLPVAVFLLFAFPLGWAYWLVRPVSQSISKGVSRQSVIFSWLAVIATLIVALVLPPLGLDLNMPNFWHVIAVISGATLVWRIVALLVPVQDPEPDPNIKAEHESVAWRVFVTAAIRHRLSLWLTRALVATALLLAIALVDTLGQCLYVLIRGNNSVGAWLGATFGSLTVLASYARRIVVTFSGGKRDRPPVSLQLIASVVALLLVGLYLITIDAGAHAISWTLHMPEPAPIHLRLGPEEIGSPEPTVTERFSVAAPAGFLISLVLAFLFGQTFSFVNNSSHNQLYSARLSRAYLGASNEKRWKKEHGVTEVLRGDDCDVSTYWPPPESNGSPLHLINVTINETLDGRSQIQQQDRKGLGMAIGPCGLSAGIEHHAVIELGKPKNTDPYGRPVKVYPEIDDPGNPPYRAFEYKEKDGEIFRGEPLTVGTWVGISGAAFSTGTGYRTSLGLSLLAGLANVRIGRWWNSGVRRGRRPHTLLSTWMESALAKIFPVQIYLLDEFFARFPGTARRHWYLTDGGHFENMGGYELIRRRLPRIIIVDAEQDTDSTFEGLASLVLKARLDFGAEIELLDEKGLENLKEEKDPWLQALLARKPCLGTLDQLRRGRWEDNKLVEADRNGKSLAHAALARVSYRFPEQEPSWLLYIKPTLTGDEPADVVKYHSAHADFPHESTGDQFFDESQWESYRKLGEHIGSLLF
ncbi:MAG TPA: hypothetical protein VH394_08295 [Thermoanaerobaculia bacterium]|jgi:hypothetical protein|nr:hypothetical protein [Thermoanaerobaculia bacterium]